MRISDWSSDVCSSDLLRLLEERRRVLERHHRVIFGFGFGVARADEQQLATTKMGVPGDLRIRQAIGQLLERVDRGIGLADVLLRACQLVIARSEEHTSELQSLMRNSYAVFCLKKKNIL